MNLMDNQSNLFALKDAIKKDQKKINQFEGVIQQIKETQL